MTTICPIILAGGGGARLWPLSRRQYPKQLLRLFGEHSLLQDTLLRCTELADTVNTLPAVIIGNEDCRFTVAEQASAVNARLQSIILEPVGRNTAPALTVAAFSQVARGADPLLLMLPADHRITDCKAFCQALACGCRPAADGRIVVFGVEPDHPATGYGYIRRGQPLAGKETPSGFELAGFTEKPDAALAERYLRSGEHLWNSGIYLVRASVWLELIEAMRSDIHRHCKAAWQDGAEGNNFHRLAATFADCPSDSVDYAVMEDIPPDGAALIQMDAGWSDVGAWSEVWRLGAKDSDNNVLSGDAQAQDTTNSLIHSENRLVAALGCDNLVIIETADAVLVLNKDKAQALKPLVATMQAAGRTESEQHTRALRPWGGYESLSKGPGYQVKRLFIRPGQRISLQLHKHRSEHWVVIKGAAVVTRNEEVFTLAVNESAFIPQGAKHRLENRTEDELEIIEVQVGDYLGEDDIVRFDDDYNR